MRILKELRNVNPDIMFLLENVEMGKKWERVLSEAIGVFGVHINSALVSAQNRKRIYWTNIRTKSIGLFGELHSDISQPYDKGILLKDILQPESEIDSKFYLSIKMIKHFAGKRGDFSNKFNPIENTGIKANCINVSTAKMVVTDNYINVSVMDINGKAKTQRSSTGRCLDDKHNYQIIKVRKNGNIKQYQDKASCVHGGGKSGGNHSDMDVICVSMVGRRVDENGTRKDNNKSITAVQRLEPTLDPGKTNCISTVQKDNLIVQLGRGKNSGGEHIEKSQTLTSNAFEQNNFAYKNYKLRRLTPLECSRLQTIPSWYRWGCSDTQAYKMLGNGWTVAVIQHIFSFINVSL